MSEQKLTADRLAEIQSLLRYESSISFHSARAKESMLLLLAEVQQWRATFGADALPEAVERLRVAEERIETVRALCDAADHAGISSGGWFTVEAVRKAISGEAVAR
ncbi:hypothetical protein ABZ636_03650 [Streptomyces sp. NPDC007251]|uniref:hypothetical protein n=1 Tax=Streptomyces sp. NPDC007251 TaxID=3154483 RepID=UPI00340545FA